MKIAEDGKLQSLQILLPDPNNIRILQAPSWWTPQRLLLGLVGLFTVLVVALSWSVMVSRRNAVLQGLIREKEQAQIGLQHANDHLEERVKERTEQLKLQITARQEAEVQFKAVLTGTHPPRAGTSRHARTNAHRHRLADGHRGEVCAK